MSYALFLYVRSMAKFNEGELMDQLKDDDKLVKTLDYFKKPTQEVAVEEKASELVEMKSAKKKRKKKRKRKRSDSDSD